MRHIFHEILARYLDDEQHVFEATSRELWPERWSTWHPPLAGQGDGGESPESARRHQVRGALEPRQ